MRRKAVAWVAFSALMRIIAFNAILIKSGGPPIPGIHYGSSETVMGVSLGLHLPGGGNPFGSFSAK
jgi:hypothetical protein